MWQAKGRGRQPAASTTLAASITTPAAIWPRATRVYPAVIRWCGTPRTTSRIDRKAREFWLSGTGPVLLARSKQLRLLIAGQSGVGIAHFGMDGHGSTLSLHEVDKDLTPVSVRSLSRGNES